MNNNTASKRLSELDVFRGLAALAVVLCHFTSVCVALGCLSDDFRYRVFHYGAYGPHLFFLISGFVIFLTLRRTETAADFVVSRLSRLFPVYWAAVCVTFVVSRFFPWPGESVSVGQALVNLTMLQTWLRVPDLDTAYWTLGVELKFYGVMFGLFLLGWLRRIDLIVGLWLSAILVYWMTVGPLGLSLPAAVATPLNVGYGHLFIAGILFYQLKTDGHTTYRHLLLVGCLATQMVVGNMESTAVVAGLFVLFHLFVAERMRWVICRPLVLLGSISYALYLLHGPIGQVVIPGLRRFTSSPTLLIVAALLTSLAVAAVVTRLIEQPALRWIRTQYQKVRQPVAKPCATACFEAVPPSRRVGTAHQKLA